MRKRLQSYQYSSTEYFFPFKNKNDPRMPAVFFFYDFFPISIELERKQVGLLSFLVRLSAVIGGGFATMGLLDKMITFV